MLGKEGERERKGPAVLSLLTWGRSVVIMLGGSSSCCFYSIQLVSLSKSLS
jgi:hypothetical protein